MACSATIKMRTRVAVAGGESVYGQSALRPPGDRPGLRPRRMSPRRVPLVIRRQRSTAGTARGKSGTSVRRRSSLSIGMGRPKAPRHPLRPPAPAARRARLHAPPKIVDQAGGVTPSSPAAPTKLRWRLAASKNRGQSRGGMDFTDPIAGSGGVGGDGPMPGNCATTPFSKDLPRKDLPRKSRRSAVSPLPARIEWISQRNVSVQWQFKFCPKVQNISICNGLQDRYYWARSAVPPWTPLRLQGANREWQSMGAICANWLDAVCASLILKRQSARAPERQSARAPERQSARAPERQSARAPERQSARAPERHDCASGAEAAPPVIAA